MIKFTLPPYGSHEQYQTMAQNLWWTLGTAVLRQAARTFSEIDVAAWLAPKPMPEMFDDDSQRSLAVTHIIPQVVPSNQTPPLVVFTESSDALIQLLNVATTVSPEVIMLLCMIGMISVVVMMLICFCTCIKCVKHRSLWPFNRRTVDHQLTHGQLSDMAMHYYSLVQAQNPGLLNMMPPDERQRNQRLNQGNIRRR